MNGVKFLLDTNIMIGVLNRSAPVMSLLTQKQVAIEQFIEDATIAFRQKYRTKLPDAIIAATAECHQLELLTLDATLAKRTLGEDSP